MKKGVSAHAINDGLRTPPVDVDNIGKFAAAALLEPAKYTGQGIEFSNQNLT